MIFCFVGTCFSEDYRNYKTARTNEYAIEILKEYFPKKRIIDLDLKKNDKVPYQGVLHLDCTFNPIGKDKCIIYKDGFVDESDYQLIIHRYFRGRKLFPHYTRRNVRDES